MTDTLFTPIYNYFDGTWDGSVGMDLKHRETVADSVSSLFVGTQLALCMWKSHLDLTPLCSSLSIFHHRLQQGLC